MTSENSSTKSNGKPTEEVKSLQTLGKMLGWESIRRGLFREDDLAHRDALAYHKLLHGEQQVDSTSSTSTEGDGMGHIVLGNMTTTNTYPKTALGMVAKAAIAAGLVGTGVVVSMIVNALNNDKPVAAPATITIPGEIHDWELGEPIVR